MASVTQNASYVGTKLALSVELISELEARATPNDLSKLVSLMETIQLFQHLVEICNAELHDAKNEIDEVKRENSELLTDLQDVLAEIERMGEESMKSKELIATLKSDANILQEEIDVIKEELSQTEIFREHYRDIKENTRRRIAKINKEKLEAERMIKFLENKLDATNARMAAMSSDQERLQLRLIASEGNQRRKPRVESQLELSNTSVLFDPLPESDDENVGRGSKLLMEGTRGRSRRRASSIATHSSIPYCPSVRRVSLYKYRDISNLTLDQEDSARILLPLAKTKDDKAATNFVKTLSNATIEGLSSEKAKQYNDDKEKTLLTPATCNSTCEAYTANNMSSTEEVIQNQPVQEKSCFSDAGCGLSRHPRRSSSWDPSAAAEALNFVQESITPSSKTLNGTLQPVTSSKSFLEKASYEVLGPTYLKKKGHETFGTDMTSQSRASEAATMRRPSSSCENLGRLHQQFSASEASSTKFHCARLKSGRPDPKFTSRLKDHIQEDLGQLRDFFIR